MFMVGQVEWAETHLWKSAVGRYFDRLRMYGSDSVAIQKQLANPPLREALLDIRLANKLPPECIESLSKLAIPGLEQKQQLKSGMFELEFGPVYRARAKSEEVIGWRLESTDGSRVVQVRTDGITYSILRGYKDFLEIKEAARKVWTLYLEQINASVVVARIAARYINVLEFPTVIELNDYLTAAPQIPKELPQELLTFLQRVTIAYPDGTHAVITQASEPTGQPGARFILDIDVFAIRTVDGRSQDLWTLIDNLRTVKNEVFFSSVTELALERYK